MTGTQEKLRSLFLVALMVLSVFAGTIAFSGSVAAASNLTVSVADNDQGDFLVNSGELVDVGFSWTSDGSDSAQEEVRMELSDGSFDPGDFSSSDNATDVTYSNGNSVATFNISDGDETFSLLTSVIVTQYQDSVTIDVEINESDSTTATDTSNTFAVTPDVREAIADATGESGERFWYGQELYIDDATAGDIYELHRVFDDNSDTSFVSDITVDADGEGLIRTARADDTNLDPSADYVLVNDANEIVSMDADGDVSTTGVDVDGASSTEYNNNDFEITNQDLEVEFNQTEFTVGDPVQIDVDSRRGTGYWVLVESPNQNFTDGELATLFTNFDGATSVPSSATTPLRTMDQISPSDANIADGAHDAVFFVDDEADSELAGTNLGIGDNVTTDNLQYHVIDTGFADGTEATDETDITVNPTAVSGIVLSGAEFSQGSYTEQTGDVAEVTVDFNTAISDIGENQRLRTYVMVGSAGDRIIDLINITDYDRDGEATFSMNSFLLGRQNPTLSPGTITPGNAYAPVSADNVSVTRPRHYTNVPGATDIAGASGSELVWGHETGSSDTPDFETPPRSGINNPLGATSYSLQSMSAPVINLSADENNMVLPAFSDAASLVLQERSLQENVSVWVGPQGSDSGMMNRSTILADVTKLNDDGAIHSNVVANGDVVVFQFHASGFEGHVSNINDMLGPNGIHTFVAQSNAPADGDRYYWDLAQHGSLIADSENDTYFVVVPTSRLTGVGTLDNAAPPNTMFEANMVIAGGQTYNTSDVGSTWDNATTGTFADFYEEGEFPDDNNFADTYNNEDFEWNLDTYDFVWHPQPWFTQQEQERADVSTRLSQRVAEFDQYVENVSELRLSANAEELVSGETNLAPGSSFRVSLQNTSAAFNRNVDVTVRLEDGQRVWNTTLDLEGEAGTPFLAQVLEAGVSITTSAQATIATAQGPAVPGLVTEKPMASVTMDDQIARDAGTLVTVHEVSMNKGGFVAIHSGSASGPVVGYSRYLSAGNYSNVDVRLDEAVSGTATLVAMPHIDTNDNHVYDWLANSNLDGPFVVNGSVVTDSASVQIPTPTPTTSTPTPTTSTPTPTTTTPTPTTTTPTPTTTTPTDEPTTTTTTEGDGPGFGIIVALVALVAAALLAVRRER